MNPVTLWLVLATLPSVTLLSVTLLSVTLPSEVNSSDTLFKKLDRNQDHQVTTDEIAESQRAFFRRALRVADRNEDGALSSEELTVALTDAKPVQLPSTNVGGRLAGMDFTQFDKNGDGQLTLDEVPASMKQRFQQMLTRSGQTGMAMEMVARSMAGERPAMDSSAKKADAKNAKQPEIKPSATQKNPDSAAGQGLRAMMQQVDRNGDGKIDPDELPPRLKQSAKQIDSNGDGKIVAAELAAAMKRRDGKKK